MKSFVDFLAYIILVGSKPLPLVLGGLVVLLTVESLASPEGDLTGLLLTLLLVTSLSLILLPPFQWIARWAEGRRQKDYSLSEAWGAFLLGWLLFTVWGALLILRPG